MSFLNLLNFAKKALIALICIPFAVKTAKFIRNLIYTINHLRDALNKAEHQIAQLQNIIEDHAIILQEHMPSTMDMQQQLIDQNINILDLSKDIKEIYECIDIIDDRLSDLIKSEKTRKIKKQVRRYKRNAEKREIEALKSPNEAVFDDFIAEKQTSVFNQDGKASSAELRQIFKEWYNDVDPNLYTNLYDRPSNRELEKYMCRNFHWNKDAWMKNCDEIY